MNIYITSIGWYGDVDDGDCPSNGNLPSPTCDNPLVLEVNSESQIADALADMYHVYPESYLYRNYKPGSQLPKDFTGIDVNGNPMNELKFGLGGVLFREIEPDHD